MGTRTKITSFSKKFQALLKNLHWKKNPQWFLPFQEQNDEIFRQIPHHMGVYFISNYGRIVDFSSGNPRRLKPVFTKDSATVVLSLDGRRKTHRVGDLVYKCFGGPMPKTAAVEYRNGNPRDNHIKNLKLNRDPGRPPAAPSLPLTPKPASTPSFQSTPEHPKGPPPELDDFQKDFNKFSGAAAADEPEPFNPRWREVLQFDVHGHYLKKFPSLKAAGKFIKQTSSAIGQCAGQKGGTAGGYQWFYRSDPKFKDGIKDVGPARLKNKEILQFSLKGKYLRSFQSVSRAVTATKIPRCSIDGNLKGKLREAYGFQFRYKADPEFRFGIRDIPAVEAIPKVHPKARKVYQFDFYGRYIAEHESLQDAGRVVGMFGSNIGACVLGKRQSTGGFQWRYADDPRFRDGPTDIEPLTEVTGHNRREVLQFDVSGKYIRSFPDAKVAGEAMNIGRQSILNGVSGYIKKCVGYQWRSINDPLFKDGIVDIPPLRYKPRKTARVVLKYNRTGRLTAEYPSIQEAADAHGIGFTKMSNLIRKPTDDNAEFSFEFRD